MKRKHWISISVIFLLFGISCFIFKDFFVKYERIISIVGSFASLFGIIIAIVQAYQAKTAAGVAAKATEDTKKAVQEGIAHVKKVISLVDISQIQHIPNEIQDSIQCKDWSRAYEKMRYLKDFMIEIQNNPIMAEEAQLKNEFVESTQKLELRINSFSKGIQDKKDPYAFNKTSELMETIRTQLKTITSKIKYNSTI